MAEDLKALKHHFAAQGAPVVSHEDFMSVVGASHFDQFTEPQVSFEPGAGGFMVDAQTGTLATVRHPDRIPHSIHDGEVRYGGVQSDTHIEVSMSRRSLEHVSEAREVIQTIETEGLAAASEKHGGPFRVGNEAEMWVHNQDGTPATLPTDIQEELHENLWETATKPVLDPEEQERVLAQDVLDRAARLPDKLIVNTSMPISGSPLDLRLNSNGEMVPYVVAMQTDMFDRLFHPKDKVARAAWESIAKQYGYLSFEELREASGNLTLWAMAAAHASIGLSHKENDNRHKEISREHVVAVGDVFNSNLGNVAEWMMYSTPLAFGVRPTVRGSSPQDVRAVLKLGVLTTYPSDFVRDAETMEERIKHAVTTGAADRMDRGSYVSELRGPWGVKHVSSAHGRLRNRIAYPDMNSPHSTTGRIEFTGAGSTPDITATVAKNSMIQLMAIHAYDAVANGVHPHEFSGKRYPALTTVDRQRYLSHRFNYVGAHDPQVAPVIDQAQQFITDIGDRFRGDPTIERMCERASFGIEKITKGTTARDLMTFADQGYRGSISAVINTMYNDGHTPEEITRAIHEFQIRQAHEFV